MHGQHQLVQEDGRSNKISLATKCNRSNENQSRGRDIFRQEAHHFLDVSQRPEAAAHLTRAEADAFTHQLSEVRETSEYCYDLRGRNSRKVIELLPNEI